ncbi:hypothetical protein BDP55DRAFT_636784 [Colletotrichum godetiae]|uniref:Rhodopsin domain-containing protein n=1 Tax=Colletotrichum godetiae TaxID=1209918 RepID=A0AAJ0ESK2_9PEZI|nr:uncharacterized protein BDP55DRAFT_636784 [Colletotrichum godetiae]KAK1659644.1 hypothetical protein BDP55DRAFT_636784 [Colletotrichum godetiae]
MATVADVVYMAEPPNGEARFAARTVGVGTTAAGVSTTVVSLLAVFLRIFTRLHAVKRSLGVDDYLIFSSWVMSVAFLVTGIKMIDLGIASNFWQVTYADYDPGCLIWNLRTRWFGKLIRLSPCLRILGHRGTTDCSMYRTAQCVDKETIHMILSIANTIMDVAILMLPLKIVIPHLMARRQEASVILLFATGTLEQQEKTQLTKLQSHDDLPEKSLGKAESSDDEIKLWSGRRYRKDLVSERETIIESEPKHHKRMCSGIIHAANVIDSDDIESASLAERNDGRITPSTAARIQVTYETKVS